MLVNQPKNPFSERSFPMTEDTNQTPSATAGYGPSRELRRESRTTASRLAPLATSRPPLRAIRVRCSAVLQSQELNPGEPAVTNRPPLCRRNPVATHQSRLPGDLRAPSRWRAWAPLRPRHPLPPPPRLTRGSPPTAAAAEDAQDHRSRAGLPAFAA